MIGCAQPWILPISTHALTEGDGGGKTGPPGI